MLYYMMQGVVVLFADSDTEEAFISYGLKDAFHRIETFYDH